MKYLFFVSILLTSCAHQQVAAPAIQTSAIQIPCNTIANDSETCFSPYQCCDTRIAAELTKANVSLDFVMYATDSAAITNAIMAARSKVSIRFIADQSMMTVPTSTVAAMKAAGIQVKTMGALSVHSKFFIVDGAVVGTGSFNFMESSHNNFENTVFIKTPSVVADFAYQFEQMWAAGSAL